MLLAPLLIVGIAACDNPGGTPATPTSAARVPYQDTPEGVPPNLGSRVPDPAEKVETVASGQLPSFAKSSSPAVQSMYMAAVNDAATYRDIPCYCGCAIYTTAHTSLESCFVKSINADGTVTFTDHSMTCDICQGIAQMAVDGAAKNTPARDIRSAVFKSFNYTGIWTDTPPTQ